MGRQDNIGAETSRKETKKQTVSSNCLSKGCENMQTRRSRGYNEEKVEDEVKKE